MPHDILTSATFHLERHSLHGLVRSELRVLNGPFSCYVWDENKHLFALGMAKAGEKWKYCKILSSRGDFSATGVSRSKVLP